MTADNRVRSDTIWRRDQGPDAQVARISLASAPRAGTEWYGLPTRCRWRRVQHCRSMRMSQVRLSMLLDVNLGISVRRRWFRVSWRRGRMSRFRWNGKPWIEHERQEAVFCQITGLVHHLSAILSISGSLRPTWKWPMSLTCSVVHFERPNPMRLDNKSENASQVINVMINW